MNATASLDLVHRPAPTWRLVLALAWPVLVQQLLILTVGLSDRAIAGWNEPPDRSQHIAFQAAQTTGNYLAWFITSSTVLVTVGSTALVARLVGGGEWAAARRATGQSLLLALVVGVAGTVAGLLGVDSLVRLLGLEGDTAVFAASYLQPLFALLPFQVIEAAAIACLIGAGDTRIGMFVRGGVALLNLPLAWGFFLGLGPLPQLGFPGITLGTAVSHAVGAVGVVAVLVRGRAGLRLDLSTLVPDLSLAYRLLRVSVPAAVDQMSLVLGQLWFLSIVNRLGDVAASAHGIALDWEGLGYLSGGAFGTAAMALVGQNLGAKQPRQAVRAGWTAFGLGCAVMCTMGLIFYTLAPQMFAVFCPHEGQRPVIEAGVPALRLVAFAMPAAASWIIFTYALRGAGDTRVPVLFTWVSFFGVRIPLAYWLTTTYGLYGAWLAMFADLVLRGALFFLRFRGGRWQQITV